jgi:preprotein translocase subunit Sss1
MTAYGDFQHPVPPPQTPHQGVVMSGKPENVSEYPLKPPKTWMLESILVTLLCCMPIGIIGLIFAAQVRSKYYKGNLVGAHVASQIAQTCFIVSLICGIIGIIGYIVYLSVNGGV